MKQITSVIEIGTSKIICAICESRDYDSFEILGMSSVNYTGIKKGMFLNPARLADSILEAVDKAEIQANKKIKSVVVGIPGSLVKVACNSADITVGSDTGIVDVEDVNFLAGEAQKFFVPERMEILHKSPIGFRLSDGRKVVSPVGMRSESLSGVFSFTTCEKDTINYLYDVFHSIKLEVSEFVGTPLTLGLMLTPPEERMSLSIVLDIGYYATDLIIMQGDGILYHSVINVGGYNFTNDLSIIMKNSFTDSEQIKRRYVFGLDTSYIAGKELFRDEKGKMKTNSNETIQAVIEARAQELLGLINKKINTLGLRLNKSTKMYITGGGMSMMRGCRELFDSYFDYDVRMPKYEMAKINTPNQYTALSIIEYANKHELGSKDNIGKKKRTGFLQKIIDFFTE